MKYGVWCFLLFVAVSAWGILPLPYPTEPLTSKLENWIEPPSRDPLSVQGYHELHAGSKAREMELPHFGSQEGTLGYEPGETFRVPQELRGRVAFWKRIYTEFTSGQALLHDTDIPSIIYGVVDVSEFTRDDGLKDRTKRKELARFLKAAKKKVKEELLTLHEHRNDPLKVPVELFSIFRKFETFKDPDRFLKASRRIRAQIGQKDKIVKGFFFGGRYFSHMMEIFERKKMPKELTRLTLVESAMDLSARSKVGASGVWQFMRQTGKRFLRVDRYVDERNDPITASWAAAELLQRNYEELQSWPLAITAYNHGRAGMMRAVRSLGTRDISTVINHYNSRTFGFASSNFYSEFLAILEIEREYRTHFGKLMVDAPIQYEEFLLNDPVQFKEIAETCDMSEEDLAAFNPALTEAVVEGTYPIPQGFRLKVPNDKLERCRSGYKNTAKVYLEPERSIASENP